MKESEFSFGADQPAVDHRLAAWEAAGFSKRLWAKDKTLWGSGSAPEIGNRLGWLDLPEIMADRLAGLIGFAREVRSDGFAHVVLLGMGGSSLAPDVFQNIFGPARGFPDLIVLDSTHPAAVAAVEKEIDLERTFFLVSSKSGTTLEPISLFRYFWGRLAAVTAFPGRQFAAITDAGTPLEALALERKFRRTFQAHPDVGGRFSALTEFGLVPAALLGVDIGALLDRARSAAAASAADVALARAPGLRLGAVLAELGTRRNKLTILTSPRLWSFPDWLEQLIAESLGKEGRGILPVAGEPAVPAERYGRDRIFAAFLLAEDRDEDLDKILVSLEKTGHPVLRIFLQESLDIGREIFDWEIAVAAAGSALGIHPFNQPDVELSKNLARQAMSRPGPPLDQTSPDEAVSVSDAGALSSALKRWLAQSGPGDYIALQAYLAPSGRIKTMLQDLRLALLRRTNLATTLGFGPRFLHSTGQFHKGGPNEGLFLQLIDEPESDLAVPETDFTYGDLIQAQALGDYRALIQKGRRVLRVNLKRDAAGGLDKIRRAVSL